MSEQQKAFHEWAKANIGQPSFRGRYIRDGVWSYDHNIIQLCWTCWQAACASKEGK